MRCRSLGAQPTARCLLTSCFPTFEARPSIRSTRSQLKNFRSLVELYRKTKAGKAERYRHEVLVLTERLNAFFGRRPVNDISKSDWDLFESNFRKTHPGQRLGNTLKHFRAIIRLGVEVNARDTFIRVRNPDPETEVGREYSTTELEQMVAYCEVAVRQHPEQEFWYRDLRLQLLLAILGMRKAEVLGLRFDRCDFTNRRICLGSDTKAKRPRFIAMPKQVHDELVARQKLAESRFVFPKKNDPTRPRTSNRTAWRRLRRELGISGRWHDHRHTATSRLIRAGHPPFAVQKKLGMSPKIVDRYSHLNSADFVAMSKSLNLAGDGSTRPAARLANFVRTLLRR